MDKEEIKKIFNNEEYKNDFVLFVTSDNKIFKKHIDAVSYCTKNNLDLLQDLDEIWKPIEMSELTNHGFKARYDTYESYMLNIDDYNIIINRHIKNTKFQCWLVENYDGNEKSSEICINEDCDFEWVLNLVELLKNK